MSALWSARGIPLAEILKQLATRSDMECRCAWEVLDEELPGFAMDELTTFARSGITAEHFITQAKRNNTQMAAVATDRDWEIYALALEHARRREQWR